MKTERRATPKRLARKTTELKSPVKKNGLNSITKSLIYTVEKELPLFSKKTSKTKLEFQGSLNSTRSENEKNLDKFIKESENSKNQALITEVAIQNVQF